MEAKEAIRLGIKQSTLNKYASEGKLKFTLGKNGRRNYEQSDIVAILNTPKPSKKTYKSSPEYIKIQKKNYYQKNKLLIKEKQKKYQLENRKIINKIKNDWRIKNPIKSKDIAIKYLNKHPERVKDNRKRRFAKYYSKNKVELCKKNNEFNKNNRKRINIYRKKRYDSDINFKLACNLRNRLICAIKKSYKKSSAISLLGCSIDFLKKYLESKFKLGMTWSNHGTTWDIDHKIPCASFDLTKSEAQKVCFHYSNLQPLFKKENQSKHKKINTNIISENIKTLLKNK